MANLSGGIADRVRDYCRQAYIEPARRRGDKSVIVIAGDVQRALHITNRIAAVCQALSGPKFLSENSLVLASKEGPPSGLSTTVKYLYTLSKSPGDRTGVTNLLALRGLAKKAYASFGGGESYLREMRKDFYGDKRDKS